jgi:hypothetical protein
MCLDSLLRAKALRRRCERGGCSESKETSVKSASFAVNPFVSLVDFVRADWTRYFLGTIDARSC